MMPVQYKLLILSGVFSLFLLNGCGEESSTNPANLSHYSQAEESSSSSSVLLNIGRFIDSRDGQAYRTVSLDGHVWMAQNLNYDTEGSYRQYPNMTRSAYGGNDASKTFGISIGRRYSTTVAQKVCPAGWHLPSRDEWSVLFDLVGGMDVAGMQLKCGYGWAFNNGRDSFGFCVIPTDTLKGAPDGPYPYICESTTLLFGYSARFWTSSNADTDYQDCVVFQGGANGVRMDRCSASDMHYIRCVQDSVPLVDENDWENFVWENDVMESSSSEEIFQKESIYDCSQYNCVTTEYLNQVKLVAGEYGEFLDTRDNHVYRTTQIGAQTWMAQNLNYTMSGHPICEKNDDNCEKYGRLYEWYSAQSACPEGWHLPSYEEWAALFTATGVPAEVIGRNGTDIKYPSITRVFVSNMGWRNSFDAIYCEGDPLGFSALSTSAASTYFWTSTPTESSSEAYYVTMYHDVDGSDSDTELRGDCNKGHFWHIRCLKDYDTTAQSSSSSEAVYPILTGTSSSSSEAVYPILTGTLTDSRDGQTYKTVTIGEQTWMAENLNYATRYISYCYEDSVSYCAKYGRLYTWAAAMDSVGTWSTNGEGCGMYRTCTPTYPVRGVCPEGWHLPSISEISSLITLVGGQSIAGQKLKAATGWTAKSDIANEDAFGFSALPGGRRYSGSEGNYGGKGTSACFWSSTQGGGSGADALCLYYDRDGVGGSYCVDLDWVDANGICLLYSGLDKFYGHSVRCIKD